MRTIAKPFSDVKRLVARFRETGPKLTPWRAIAHAHYPGIAEARMATNLCAIYKHGREPHANDIRRALGMAEYAPAVVCPVHGVVHKGRCPRKTFEENAAKYETWRTRNLSGIADIVAWAEGRESAR